VQSNSGSPEPSRTFGLADLKAHVATELAKIQVSDEAARLGPMPLKLTEAEQDRIADGEAYCFRCGKPASSFEEYKSGAEAEGLISAWQYVILEEGTYNRDTNRFACDACYIAIGMPAGPDGWEAP
jgi:hypothetical protein